MTKCRQARHRFPRNSCYFILYAFIIFSLLQFCKVEYIEINTMKEIEELGHHVHHVTRTSGRFYSPDLCKLSMKFGSNLSIGFGGEHLQNMTDLDQRSNNIDLWYSEIFTYVIN